MGGKEGGKRVRVKMKERKEEEGRVRGRVNIISRIPFSLSSHLLLHRSNIGRMSGYGGRMPVPRHPDQHRDGAYTVDPSHTVKPTGYTVRFYVIVVVVKSILC
jgi:hypothetical protein